MHNDNFNLSTLDYFMSDLPLHSTCAVPSASVGSLHNHIPISWVLSLTYYCMHSRDTIRRRKHIDYDNQVIIEHKKKRYIPAHFDGELTTMLLEILNTSWGVTNIGFYILKRVRRWDIEKFIEDYKDWSDKENRINKLRKQMTKEKSVDVPSKGYDKYFLLDGRALRVENFDLQNAKIKQGTKGELKRIFGKSMKNRLVSRVLLNKFIAEVA